MSIQKIQALTTLVDDLEKIRKNFHEEPSIDFDKLITYVESVNCLEIPVYLREAIPASFDINQERIVKSVIEFDKHTLKYWNVSWHELVRLKQFDRL